MTHGPRSFRKTLRRNSVRKRQTALATSLPVVLKESSPLHGAHYFVILYTSSLASTSLVRVSVILYRPTGGWYPFLEQNRLTEQPTSLSTGGPSVTIYSRTCMLILLI